MQVNDGINQMNLKESNLSQIIRTLFFDENCTRVSLSRKLGLSQASITNLVNLLIQKGLVSDSDNIESSKGRRPVRLKLNREKFLTLCGRLNRDYVSVALYDLGGRLHRYTEEKVDYSTGVQPTIQLLKTMMKNALDNADQPVLGIGMALPGPFDTRNNCITLMSGFPGWQNVDIHQELSSAFDLPIFLGQDANCGALAEQWYGVHRNLKNMIYVAGDRGVGAGLILNGQLYQGMLGFAGELGHLSINCFGPLCECGNRGCLELYSSTTALEETYTRLLFEAWQQGEYPDRPSRIKAQEICRMVRNDDPLAKHAYKSTVSYLAIGLVGVINTLNPEAVIFGDKITEGGLYFLDVIKETFRRHLMPDVYNNLIIDRSALQDLPSVRDPMLLGAGVLVLEHLLELPSQFC